MRWVAVGAAGAEKGRIAAVVPKKVSKTAVERNKMRRRIYEAVRKAHPDLPSSIHAALFAKQPAKTAEFAALKADIRELFTKTGIIKPAR